MKKSMKMKGGCMDTSVTVLLIIVFAVAVIGLAYYFMYVYNKHSTPTSGPTVMPTMTATKLMKEHFTSSELTPSDNEIIVALFAADEWCGYCKQYAPVWEKITAQHKDKEVNGKKVRFVKIDCSGETPQSATDLGVKGFPTLVAISSSGSPKHLEGRNSMDEIEAQLKSL
jgi:thiol-disulfide isomerase/thioredoxin